MWCGNMTEQEKKELYDRQVDTLKAFLGTGAITEEQFKKSFGDLTAKMFPEKENN